MKTFLKIIGSVAENAMTNIGKTNFNKLHNFSTENFTAIKNSIPYRVIIEIIQYCGVEVRINEIKGGRTPFTKTYPSGFEIKVEMEIHKELYGFFKNDKTRKIFQVFDVQSFSLEAYHQILHPNSSKDNSKVNICDFVSNKTTTLALNGNLLNFVICDNRVFKNVTTLKLYTGHIITNNLLPSKQLCTLFQLCPNVKTLHFNTSLYKKEEDSTKINNSLNKAFKGIEKLVLEISDASLFSHGTTISKTFPENTFPNVKRLILPNLRNYDPHFLLNSMEKQNIVELSLCGSDNLKDEEVHVIILEFNSLKKLKLQSNNNLSVKSLFSVVCHSKIKHFHFDQLLSKDGKEEGFEKKNDFENKTLKSLVINCRSVGNEFWEIHTKQILYSMFTKCKLLELLSVKNKIFQIQKIETSRFVEIFGHLKTFKITFSELGVLEQISNLQNLSSLSMDLFQGSPINNVKKIENEVFKNLNKMKSLKYLQVSCCFSNRFINKGKLDECNLVEFSAIDSYVKLSGLKKMKKRCKKLKRMYYSDWKTCTSLTCINLCHQ